MQSHYLRPPLKKVLKMQVLDTPVSAPAVSAETSFWARAKTATVCAVSKARGTAAAATGAVLGFAGQAHAALPAEVTTALADAKEDGVTLGGLVLVIVIAIAAFKFLRRGI